MCPRVRRYGPLLMALLVWSRISTLLAADSGASAVGYGVAIGQVTVSPSDTAVVTVTLTTTDQPISAIQFDIQYPAAALQITVAAGSALDPAQKTFRTNTPQPGTVRILIAGLNQTPIPDGTIATVSAQVAAGTFPIAYPLQVANVIGSDAAGNTIALFSANGGITVAGPVVSAIVNGANYAVGAVAPGEIVVIGGNSLAVPETNLLQLTDTGFAATALAGTRVLFDGVAAPLLYTTPQQVSVFVPYAVYGLSSTAVQVEAQGILSAAQTLAVTDAAPGIFTTDASGVGQAAVLNQDGNPNSADNPAPRGSVISIYGTGEGQTDPAGIDGFIVPASGLRKPKLAVVVTIGGQPAKLSYAGSAGNQVSGVFQVNAYVPDSITPGAAVPLTITVGDKSSQSGVTIAVQ